MRAETVAEQLFFATVRITTSHVDGSTGVGTGFLYTVPTTPDQEATFLVTNKHVVLGASKVTLHFIGATDTAMSAPLLGTVHSIEVTDPSAAFRGHLDPGVDVSIAPVTSWLLQLRSAGYQVFYRSISPTLALTSVNVAELDALEEVTFLGYPNGLFDASNGLPIARRGLTASPLALDYEGKPIFLVDGAVYPGSSGSPVFLLQTGGFAARDGGFVVGGRLMWLGVIAAVYERAVPVLTVPTAGGSFVRDPLNIGIVYKARAVDELVDVILAEHGLVRHIASQQPPVEVPNLSDDALAEGDG